MKFLQKFGRFHGDGDSGSVVDGAGAEVPGIEVAGDDDDLLGMFAAFQIGDHVIASGVGQFLRSEGEVHAHVSLGGEVGDQVAVFGGDGACGNSCGDAEAGVRQAEVGAADGAYQCGHRAQVGCGFWTGGAVADRFAVGHEGHASLGFALIEEFR